MGRDGIEFVIAAVLEGLLGLGLWRLKNWARVVAIVLSALGAVFLLREILVGNAAKLSTLSFSWTISCLGVNALIVWYLLKSDVSATFHRSQAG